MRLLPAPHLQGPCLYLVCRVNIKNNVQGLLGSQSVSLHLIYLMCLKLGEDVSEKVEPAFVDSLQLLEDIRGLGIPLYSGSLELCNGVSDLGCGSLRALVPQLFGLLLGHLDLLGHGSEVSLYCGHGLDLSVGRGELSQGALDIGLNFLCELVVRVGDGVGCADNLVPGRREDAAAR